MLINMMRTYIDSPRSRHPVEIDELLIPWVVFIRVSHSLRSSVAL